MLTIEDIMQVKSDMEEESYLTCSDLFIERLRQKEDEKFDAVARALKGENIVPDWFKSGKQTPNTPPNTDGEGGFTNSNV